MSTVVYCVLIYLCNTMYLDVRLVRMRRVFILYDVEVYWAYYIKDDYRETRDVHICVSVLCILSGLQGECIVVGYVYL